MKILDKDNSKWSLDDWCIMIGGENWMLEIPEVKDLTLRTAKRRLEWAKEPLQAKDKECPLDRINKRIRAGLDYHIKQLESGKSIKEMGKTMHVLHELNRIKEKYLAGDFRAITNYEAENAK